MLKKYLILLALGFSALVHAPAWAQTTDSEAMNMAGLQRSLTQRMAKNYLMIGADVRVDAAQRQLQETIQRFDASHKALTAYAPNAEIKAALNSTPPAIRPPTSSRRRSPAGNPACGLGWRDLSHHSSGSREAAPSRKRRPLKVKGPM